MAALQQSRMIMQPRAPTLAVAMSSCVCLLLAVAGKELQRQHVPPRGPYPAHLLKNWATPARCNLLRTNLEAGIVSKGLLREDARSELERHGQKAKHLQRLKAALKPCICSSTPPPCFCFLGAGEPMYASHRAAPPHLPLPLARLKPRLANGLWNPQVSAKCYGQGLCATRADAASSCRLHFQVAAAAAVGD